MTNSRAPLPRRAVLGCGTTAVSLLAGCLGERADADPDDDVDDAVLDDEELTDIFESQVEVRVKSLTVENGVVVLEYYDEESANDAMYRTANDVARDFSGVVKSGWNVERLEATAYDEEQPSYSFMVEAEWALAFRDELDEEEYHAKIAETMETH